MTNIVYWNIQIFGINKIADPDNINEDPNTGGLTYAGSSANRYALIRNTINPSANNGNITNADIIVIVEVSAIGARAGDLAVNGAGIEGAQRILTDLRAADLAAGWRMAPPLKLSLKGNTETVAVLYRGVSFIEVEDDPDNPIQVTRYFTGPNTWTGGANGVSSDAGNAAATDYPAPYNDFLGVPRQIPQGAQYRGNDGLKWESQSAARISFQPVPIPVGNKRLRSETNNEPVYWGNSIRVPFMTSFYEVFNDGITPPRNLTLFSIHTSPEGREPTIFVDLLRKAVEIVTLPIANEIKIICGDFNLNALNRDGSRSNVYAPLTTAPVQYIPLINPPVAMPAGTDLRTYQGYFATHIQLPRVPDIGELGAGQPIAADRFLWSDGVTASNYPGYNYFDPVVPAKNNPGNFYSIDNILVWRGVPVDHDYQLTILNPVVGSPFDRVNTAPPPDGPPTGAIAFAPQFTALPVGMGWPQNPAPAYMIGDADALIGWGNYGRIINTSDHLALFARI